MEDLHIYQKIISAIRQDVISGRLKPGDRLPTVRENAQRWGCTIGTVQRAYNELSRQGLVISRTGQGTRIVDKPTVQDDTPLRRAMLVHRAEAFLLDTVTAGYTPAEVESALQMALDSWRAISQAPQAGGAGVLRFAGSHDLALSWLAAHFPDEAPRFTIQVGFSGSLGGLMALQAGQADLAGCHLWDEETETYNAPFVRRLLPGRRVALLTLATRRLGLLLTPDNPLNVVGLPDLATPGLRFVNRQPGSGTRVWLDAALRRLDVDAACIDGYATECSTHTEVARRIAEGKADVGFGLETAALAFGLDFIPLVTEPYDLVIPAENMETPAVQHLVQWLTSAAVCQAIADLGGYDTRNTGALNWVN